MGQRHGYGLIDHSSSSLIWMVGILANTSAVSLDMFRKVFIISIAEFLYISTIYFRINRYFWIERVQLLFFIDLDKAFFSPIFRSDTLIIAWCIFLLRQQNFVFKVFSHLGDPPVLSEDSYHLALEISIKIIANLLANNHPNSIAFVLGVE